MTAVSRGLLLVLCARCSGATDAEPPRATTLSGGWVGEMVLDPACFTAAIEAYRDAWIAVHAGSLRL
jgi:hypothetical protein